MFEQLLDFLSDNRLYIGVGILVAVATLCSDKFRKYFGKLITLFLLLLVVAFAYMMATREKGPVSSETSWDENAEDQGVKRKSIYYHDPEEKLRQDGEGSPPTE